MNKFLPCCFLLCCFLIVFSSCVPYSFSPPTQIHINPQDPDDHVTEPAIAVDAAGRSHIAGKVNDRVVYTRTTFGDPKISLTMTMDHITEGWEQYRPDIAVTDNGTAWLVWTEQRGPSGKVACYRVITPVPPEGGYSTNCLRLDSSFFSAGNVMVVARGNKAYALYDAVDSAGRVDSLWYKELTQTSNTGLIISYGDWAESGWVHSWDAGIDSQGYLHVAFLDDDGYWQKRLFYRSNADTYEDGSMKQAATFSISDGLYDHTPISLTIWFDGTKEIMSIAYVVETEGICKIVIDACAADGSIGYLTHFVTLPPAWSTYSQITDLEVLGIGATLHLGFIGENSSTLDPQVYYKSSAFSSDPPSMLTKSRPTHKYDLEAAKVDPRPESPLTDSFATFSWGERDSDSMEYYSFDGGATTNIYNTNCLTSQVYGETASNGVYHAGVFKACGDTWFTTQANVVYLPVISK